MVSNTTVEWTTIGGVSGRKFTATNGNTLFLPSAGYRFGTELVGLGEGGGYWSSSLFENDPSRALGFGLRDCSTTDGGRNYGQSVRPVRLASQN